MSAPAADARMDRPEALAIAKAFVGELDGTYTELTVAGSLRRRLARIGDIEVVAQPRYERQTDGLFRDIPTNRDLLHARMHALLEDGTVQKRLDVNGTPRWGPTLRYLTYQGARVDLLTPSPACLTCGHLHTGTATGRFDGPCVDCDGPIGSRYGWILLLRTGPAAFSRQLVVPKGRTTKDGRPGLLPATLAPRDGWLTRRVSGERLHTPTEQQVFDLFGLTVAAPWERT